MNKTKRICYGEYERYLFGNNSAIINPEIGDEYIFDKNIIIVSKIIGDRLHYFRNGSKYIIDKEEFPYLIQSIPNISKFRCHSSCKNKL